MPATPRYGVLPLRFPMMLLLILQQLDTVTAIDVADPTGTVTVGTVAPKLTGLPVDTKQWTFTVPANLTNGVVVAVQLDGYQRVVFPAAAEEAELPETDLVLLAKLKSAPERVYARYDTVDVVFTFEGASADEKIGAPGMLHESDVVLFPATGSNWNIRGVSGNNTVMLQADGGTAPTAPATLTLSPRIALDATKTSDGESDLFYDVTPPAEVTGPKVSALSGDRAPADGKWVNAFDIQFTVTDVTDLDVDPYGCSW